MNSKTTGQLPAPRVLWVDGEGSAPLPPVLKDLLAGESDSAFGTLCAFDQVADTDTAARPLTGADAVVLSLSPQAADTLLQWPVLPSLCAESAVVVLVSELSDPMTLQLLRAGIQDVVLRADAASLSQRLVLAIERRRLENEVLKAHATDLKTGLPNRQQLIEHMSQLMALREREHRPVSVVVLRIDGLERVEAAHGKEAANVVRRKVAVRLRAGLRASDVVASLGANVFAALLPAMESLEHIDLVIDKLLRAVKEPFQVAASNVRLTAAAGAGHFPQDGQQPEELLRHASGLALLGSYGGQDAANE